MAGKTKEMLHKELLSLECQVADLYKEIREINIEKEYWFVKAERYRCLYNKEKLRNMSYFENDKDFYEKSSEKEFEELTTLENKISMAIEEIKRSELKQNIQSYGIVEEDSLIF